MAIEINENSRLAFNISSRKSNIVRTLLGEDAPEGEINLDLIDHLASFEHPFEKSVMCGIEELAESIKASGLWQPIVVRPKAGGRYELLAGHRRTAAAGMAGLKTIKAIINDCDDDTAKLIVTETNTCQREEIFPSERAKAYKMQLEALKNQGKRNDLIVAIDEMNNFGTIGTEVKYARDIVAELNHTSNAEISRYIRINELINELLEFVDDKIIPVRAAVELSYLSINEQRALAAVIKANEDLKVTIALAEQLRSISKNQEVTEDVIDAWVHPEAEETDKLVKAGRPVYKRALKKVESYIKKLTPEKAEKLALADEETLESKIREAIESYLDSL